MEGYYLFQAVIVSVHFGANFAFADASNTVCFLGRLQHIALPIILNRLVLLTVQACLIRRNSRNEQIGSRVYSVRAVPGDNGMRRWLQPQMTLRPDNGYSVPLTADQAKRGGQIICGTSDGN